MDQIKHLPRDEKGNFARTFPGANGSVYTIRSQEEGIGINRYCRLLNMSSVWGLQADLGSQLGAWKKAVDSVDRAIIGKASFGEFFGVAQSAVDGINRAGKTNYTYAFWVACLFITREGENITQFIEADQEAKIADWAAAGYHEQDFEDLVKKKLAEFSKPSAESRKEEPQKET